MANDGHAMETAPYLTLEQSASSLRDWEPTVVPGLLQTAEYARHVLAAADPGLLPADLDQAVALRLKRQEIWARESPPPPVFAAIISEAALVRLVGTPEIMRGQLGHLLSMTEQHPGLISVQVLPFDAGASVGLLAPFVLASFPDSDQKDAAFLDDTLNGTTTEAHGTVAKLRVLFDALGREAENRAGSIRMIREAEARWTRRISDGGNPGSAATATA